MNVGQRPASPSEARPVRSRRSVRPRLTALALPALLALAAGPVDAQSGTTTVPSDFDLVAAPPVVAPGTLSPDHQFTQAVTGFFNDDSIPDVAVVADGVVHVLLNPGFWSARMTLPGTEVRDLALVRRENTQGDGLLTASASGATLWRWKASPSPVFAPYPLTGAWTDLQRVVAEGNDWDPQLNVLCLLDGASNTLHSRVLFTDADPALPPVFLELFYPLALPNPPQAIALFQWQPGGYPQVAVADATGLGIWSTGGALLQSWSANVTSSFLCPVERDASRNVARKLAWVRQVAGMGAQRVVLIGEQGSEPALNLGNAYTTSVAAGSTTLSVVDVDYVPDEDLVLGRFDGTAQVLQNECGQPEGQHGGATTFEAGCTLTPGQTALQTWVAQGRPVVADFDVDGWDDLVTWDDAQGTALLSRRGLPRASPSNIGLRDLQMKDWESGPPSTQPPSVHLVLDGCALQLDTARVDVIVWRSAGASAAPIELDPVSIGYGSFDVSAVPCGPDGWPVSVELALSEGDRPPFIGIEIRALDAGDHTTQVVTQLMTRECDAYNYLYCELGVEFYQLPPGCQAPKGPLCPFVLPPTVGDYIAGLLPVPRLPPFEDNQAPIIIVQ